MRESFRSVAEGGLSQEILPVRLYNLAKQRFWDPAAIDFSRDVEDWRRLTAEQRDVILRLTSLFQAGEEAVTLDLLPLIGVIAGEGRVEEEMYLTTFLFEEAKHVEFFRRFLNAVGARQDLHLYHTPSYRRVFYEELPRAMRALATDSSPRAQAEAAVTYNLIIEGVLAETGYHGYFSMLKANGIMPGLASGVEKTKNDESRHLAWGIYHCSRLVAADPSLLAVIHARAAALFEPALQIMQELFSAYEITPFGLTIDTFLDYAVAQYQSRIAAIERAQGKTVEEITRLRAEDLAG